MKIAVFWDVASCSLIELNDASEVLTAMMMEAIRTSETSVNF
jgi:hypothetical protein